MPHGSTLHKPATVDEITERIVQQATAFLDNIALFPESSQLDLKVECEKLPTQDQIDDVQKKLREHFNRLYKELLNRIDITSVMYGSIPEHEQRRPVVCVQVRLLRYLI